MNLQMLVVLAATAFALVYLLRDPLRTLLGGGSCTTGTGCGGCTAACPARKRVIPGRLP